jgi:hypothetical protein
MQMAVTIISIIVGAFGGGACGAIITVIATSRRDRRQRRDAFRGFLRQWQAELSLPERGPTNLSCRTDPAIISYDSKLPTFIAEVERVRGAFNNTQEFEALTGRLADLQPQDSKRKPRDVILKALNDLISFTHESKTRPRLRSCVC